LETHTEVKNFIVDNFMMGRDPADLTDTVSLLDLGIIDSTGVLELVGFLEQTFQISVEDDELVPENLDTINRICAYIGRKKQ
jgi:acyl carrier protein